mgnify:CR=1 FL=1
MLHQDLEARVETVRVASSEFIVVLDEIRKLPYSTQKKHLVFRLADRWGETCEEILQR